MKNQNRFSIQGRSQSFKYAFEGLVQFFKTEHNAWLHLIATVCIFLLSVFLSVSRTEAIALFISVALVWITEIFNTCIEKSMDVITEEYNSKIKFIKDLSAGGVLVAAFFALVIGAFVFVPKFIEL